MPLPNVTGKILAKVIEYCSFHVNNSKDITRPASSQPTKTEDEIKSWDAEFMKVDQSTLFEIILVSYHLPQQGTDDSGNWQRSSKSGHNNGMELIPACIRLSYDPYACTGKIAVQPTVNAHSLGL